VPGRFKMATEPEDAAVEPREHELFEQARIERLAHELRTPLTVILGYAELLHGGNPRPDQKGGLEAISMAGADLNKLIEEILDVSGVSIATNDLASVITAMSPTVVELADTAADVTSLRGHGRPLGKGAIDVEPRHSETRVVRSPSATHSLQVLVEAQRIALVDLQKTADTDFLTNIGNRRAIEHRLETEWHRAHRHERPLAVLMVDIDGLKTINDTWGHLIGDYIIAEVARRLVGAIRMEDEVGRIGGDEFMVVCPDTDAESARTIVRKLTSAISSQRFEWLDGGAAVQVAIGSASTSAHHVSTKSLIKAADVQLYSRKNQRPRVGITNPPGIEVT
jgi:diguanylate cyclase (GGDEF)-like protein